MFTTQGGVEIEDVAANNPDALVRLHIDPLEGFQPWVARRLVYGAGVEDPSEQKQIAAIVEQLYRCFVECDAMLCEINPLIVTPDGEVKALDSKFTVDDSALYRHADIAEFRDTKAADPLEALAREKGVTYVKLDGSVGILGNGAGLSMSTVDVVTFAGGSPANFCDLGGGGDAETVVNALEVITADKQVRSILFNIFGGITRGDEVRAASSKRYSASTSPSRSSSASTARTPRKAGRSSPTRRRRTFTSSRRCSRPPSGP
jgi:Succinyl-CoA synthetase, beta subunit